MPKPESEIFQVGVVTATHGLRGDLKVRPLSPDSDSLLNAELVFLARPGEEPREFVPVRATRHKNSILLRLEGLDHISKVEGLVKSQVFMRFSDLQELPEDEYYWHELEGMRVTDRRCGDLGTVREMFTTAAHDVLVVQGPHGEVLIPLVDEMVVGVDQQERHIEVDLPEGLVPEADDL